MGSVKSPCHNRPAAPFARGRTPRRRWPTTPPRPARAPDRQLLLAGGSADPSASLTGALEQCAGLCLLEAGRCADIVPMRGDPIADITCTEHVDFVMIRGRVLHRTLTDT
ncbi:hypothetical protein GCM10009727_89500 [Actinomadura napierensis]|uniref:Amidohydrolase family protein n=1 Tax=Actinomadura napierensis TaxID=267854 RepID=A0ABN3AGY3_9ACTN